jgi:hypothetical protein
MRHAFGGEFGRGKEARSHIRKRRGCGMTCFMGGDGPRRKRKANAEFAEVRRGQREEKPTKSPRQSNGFAITI